jgi:D-alanyl-D-alanine carboxypeptidase/D-alanyl-D-alanine-endopeptidase (penicillin-binding protein 4)
MQAPAQSDAGQVALEYRPLIEALSAVVSDPLIESALVAARVDSLTTGHTLYAHNPELLINPASVTKIFTTAAALALLHPNYRFKTEIYTTRKPEKGVIKGPLYLKGFGDPFLVNERLTYLATELKSLGITRIDGPIILDDSHFDPVEKGPGWSQDDSPRPYSAPMGALSLNFNSVAVLAFPGEKVGDEARLEVAPDSDHFELENKVKTSSSRTRIRLSVDRKGNHTKIIARGRVSIHHPGSRHFCRVTSPAFYTGRSFRQALRQAGIKTRQAIHRGEVPRWADKLYVLRSPSLGELVRKVNKRSQNFMAEQLYKIQGAEFLGPPATWYKGQQMMSAFLVEEVGLAPSSFVLHNGSGLNDVNRITVSQAVAVLRYMWERFDVRPDFVSSLAVAGSDGTVVNRFRHPALTRTMRLKTGSLENVRALAGYVHTRGDEVLAFSFIVSRYDCLGYEVNRLINRFAAALAQIDRDHMLIEEVLIPNAPHARKAPTIGGEGPPEGHEDASIPMGEKLPDPEDEQGSASKKQQE